MRVVIYSPPGMQGEVLRRDTQKHLGRLGIKVNVELQTDDFSFARAGVMFTPAVSINGTLISNGWVPEPQEFDDALVACVS
jgi:hypothetical protein